MTDFSARYTCLELRDLITCFSQLSSTIMNRLCANMTVNNSEWKLKLSSTILNYHDRLNGALVSVFGYLIPLFLQIFFNYRKKRRQGRAMKLDEMILFCSLIWTVFSIWTGLTLICLSIFLKVETHLITILPLWPGSRQPQTSAICWSSHSSMHPAIEYVEYVLSVFLVYIAYSASKFLNREKVDQLYLKRWLELSISRPTDKE